MTPLPEGSVPQTRPSGHTAGTPAWQWARPAPTRLSGVSPERWQGAPSMTGRGWAGHRRPRQLSTVQRGCAQAGPGPVKSLSYRQGPLFRGVEGSSATWSWWRREPSLSPVLPKPPLLL